MIIYRPHKGGLAESMAESKEFADEEEMKAHIYQDWKKSYQDLGFKSAPFEIDDIVIDNETIEDARCGWHDTRYVCIKRFGNEKYGCPQCIGMCATNYGIKK